MNLHRQITKYRKYENNPNIMTNEIWIGWSSVSAIASPAEILVSLI